MKKSHKSLMYDVLFWIIYFGVLVWVAEGNIIEFVLLVLVMLAITWASALWGFYASEELKK